MQELLRQRGQEVHQELRRRGWHREEVRFYPCGEDELKFLVPKHVPHPYTNDITVPAFHGSVEDVADLVEGLIDAEEEQEGVDWGECDDISELDTTRPRFGEYRT